MVLLTFLYKNSISFFQEYINKEYFVNLSSEYVTKYTSIWLFLLVIIIIAFGIAVIVLLSHKKKPTLFYILMVSYYLVLFILFCVLRKYYSILEFELIEPAAARAIRDTTVLLFLPQFYFIAVTFIRAIGFNLKKFDFVSDLKELELISSDNEEFEFNVSFDNETALRKVRKFFREIKYYFYENKLLIIIFLIIIGIIVGYLLSTSKKESLDITYSQNKEFIYNNINYIVKDSYITNIDYNGKELDQYYLIVNINTINKSGKYRTLDYKNYKLVNGKNVYEADVTKNEYFIDFNPVEYPKSLSNKSNIESILVYAIGRKNTGKFKLRLFNGTASVKKDMVSKNIFINLKPKKINNEIIENRFNNNETITFSDSFLKNTSIKVNNCRIVSAYKYNYSLCKKDKCDDYVDIITASKGSNNLLVCNSIYDIDTSSNYYSKFKTIDFFIKDFAYIKNIKDDKYIKTINATPETASDFISFEISNKIESVNDLAIVFKIRNYEYKLFLNN